MNKPVFKENVDGTEGAQELFSWKITFSSPTGYIVASQLHLAPSVLEGSAVHPTGLDTCSGCWFAVVAHRASASTTT